MKLKITAILLLLSLLLAGCNFRTAGQQLDQAEERLDQFGDSVEDAVESALSGGTSPNSTSSTNPAPSGSAGTQPTVSLTAAEAQSIALNHAGFAPGEVSGLHTEYDRDDGITHYDVEFYQNGQEYDYEIDAQSGEILSVQSPTAQIPAATVSREQAQEIALNHANLTAADVTGLRSEYDTDDGAAHYDVEFRYNGLEYDYKIHAQTGEILSFEQDD